MSKQMGVMLPFALPLLHLVAEQVPTPEQNLYTRFSLVARDWKHLGGSWRSNLQYLWSCYLQQTSSHKVAYLSAIVFAVAFTIIAFIAQNSSGALQNLDAVPLIKRLQIICGGFLHYLGKYVVPFDLSFHYHNYREDVSLGKLVVGVLGVSAIVISSLQLVRVAPRYSAAMLWYLISIFPVIGVVSIGDHLMADRYSDWPLLLVHYWVASSILVVSSLLFRDRKLAFGFFSVPLKLIPAFVLLFLIAIQSQRQIDDRKDSVSMLQQALRVDEHNPRAHQLLGLIALREEDYASGRYHTEQAIQGMPWNAHAHNNLGLIELNAGNIESAKNCFRRAISELPGFIDAESNLALAFIQDNEFEEALEILEPLAKSNPDDFAVHINLASLHRRLGNDERSLTLYAETIRLSPNSTTAWYYYGVVAERLDQQDQAFNGYLEAWHLSNGTLAEAAEGLNRLKDLAISKAAKQDQKVVPVFRGQ
jgi:protein O-mannosyl-transferase